MKYIKKFETQQNKLVITDDNLFDTPIKLNEYLTKYIVRNDGRRHYTDEVIVDNDMNILFGGSYEENKFKYNIEKLYLNDTKESFIIYDNITKKKGVVDKTGKKIIVEPQFNFADSYKNHWLLYDNFSIGTKGNLMLVNFEGDIKIKKTDKFSNIAIDTNKNGTLHVLYLIKGETSYKYMPYDEFCSTDWDVHFDSKKYNL